MHIRASLRAAAVVACLLAALVPAATAAARSGVIPPNASPHGRSYAEWSAAWWQFDLSYPVHDPANPSVVINPQFVGVDPATVDCAFHQSGHVWFLQGSSNNGIAHRSCSVPTGTMLFFPIFDSWVDNSNCDGLPPTTLTEAQLRSIIAPNIEAITNTSLTIDGRPVGGLGGAFRVQSPVFSYTVGADNWINFVFCGPSGSFSAQTVTGAVADGIYVMLAPLSPGRHVVHWTATGGGFIQDITYTLTVVPRGRF